MLTAPSSSYVDDVLGTVVIGGITHPGSVVTVNSGSTNYAAGINAAISALAGSTKPRKIVVFLSDGQPNAGGSIGPALATRPPGTTFYTFAVGAAANCASGGSIGSLGQMAALTGGTCKNVTNAADLPNILPAVTGSNLDGLELTVDGGTPTPISSTNPALGPGPLAGTYSVTTGPLAPGHHDLCVFAHGSDAGGTDSVHECVRVLVNSPPIAKCKDVTVAADGTCTAGASVDDGSFDPDVGQAITCTASPSGPYGLVPTSVTLTCTDPLGASASCVGTVTVVDETPPALTCPADQVLECQGGAATASDEAVASDACGVPTVGCTPPSGSSFALGDGDVSCAATDAAGNASSCGFQVRVQDTTPPVVTTIAAPISLWPPNHKYRDISLAECVTAVTDACGGPLALA